MKLHIVTHLFLLTFCQARIHELQIRNDARDHIPLTTFGFLRGGYVDISFRNFTFHSDVDTNLLFGLTFEKVSDDGEEPRIETYGEKCILEPSENSGDSQKKYHVVFFHFDLENQTVAVTCFADSSVAGLLIYRDIKPSLSENGKDIINFRKGSACTQKTELPLTKENGSYGTQFTIVIPNPNAEGLYNLIFHSCANYQDNVYVESSFIAKILERNVGSYLSAGDIMLPYVCAVMSAIFFLLAIFWTCVLHKSRHPVYKIHYLMDSLVIVKSLALLFHGINYYYISERGEHVATWAILYYVTKVFKGALLFITIILIGTGWTFIKHILSPKDKRIFMIVIPLQVFANVAEIIMEESEEGDVEYRIWMDIFTSVDLLCCFAILFPIIWSIKHLQDASQTDGKAAINLRKLKIFRQFYIMIICYVYFTRLIVYILERTIPFQYTWLHEVLRQMAIFVFFMLTGYQFKPATENPYFHVIEEDDGEIEVFSQCGFAEGLSKVNRVINEAGSEDKDTLLVSKRASDYVYD